MNERFWLALSILTLSCVLISSLFWISDHPYGVAWDDAEYFNRVLQDRQRAAQGAIHFFGGGPIYFLGSMLLEDRYRPPAYRAFVGPFVYLFGFGSVTVRSVSLSFFLLSLVFIYLAGRSIS